MRTYRTKTMLGAFVGLLLGVPTAVCVRVSGRHELVGEAVVEGVSVPVAVVEDVLVFVAVEVPVEVNAEVPDGLVSAHVAPSTASISSVQRVQECAMVWSR